MSKKISKLLELVEELEDRVRCLEFNEERREALAEAAHNPYAPARVKTEDMTLGANEIADFRHTVRHGAPGTLVSCQGCQAQFDFFKATEFTLSDGTRLYTDGRHPGIYDKEWSMWVD